MPAYVPEAGGMGTVCNSDGQALPRSWESPKIDGKYSQRRPRLSVRRGLAFKSSSTKAAIWLNRCESGTAPVGPIPSLASID